MKDWTPEQLKNAQMYMVCRVCGEPREAKLIYRTEGGQVFAEHSIVCPNGHPQ